MKLPVFPKPWRDFRIPLYGGRVIAYRDRAKHAEAVMACGGAKDDDETCRGVCFPAENDAGHRLYVLGWFDGEPPTLVHECGHIAMFIVNHAGMDPRDSSGEAYCYILDFVFGSIYKGKS